MKGLRIVKKASEKKEVKKETITSIEDFFKQETPEVYTLVINGKEY